MEGPHGTRPCGTTPAVLGTPQLERSEMPATGLGSTEEPSQLWERLVFCLIPAVGWGACAVAGTIALGERDGAGAMDRATIARIPSGGQEGASGHWPTPVLGSDPASATCAADALP
jgi:hypothetical protein